MAQALVLRSLSCRKPSQSWGLQAEPGLHNTSREGVNRSTKKNASVGLFSMFCHPLAVYVPVYKLIFHILSRLLYKVFWVMEC